ncbi:hypothetical protein [Streptomyces sp. NPDC127119]|uniref:hypothetical protein n=1 Tax=Streptomyces sp. NPDC127119 TaxID=3345370 RepID=UPI00363FAF2F
MAIIVAAIGLYAQIWVWYITAIKSIIDPKVNSGEIGLSRFGESLSKVPAFAFALIVFLFLCYIYALYLISAMMVVFPYAFVSRVMSLGTASRRSKAAVARQTVLVGRVAVVVISANRMRREGFRKRPQNVNRLVGDVGSLKRQIAHQHQSVYVPIMSARARRLRNHQRVVIAALGKVEEDLDRNPIDASRKLAEFSIEIAERYAKGLYGALLSSEEIEGIDPVRDWEPFRLIVAAVVIAGAAIAVAFFDIPDPAITALMGAAGLIAITLLYGRGARSALDVVDVVRG